VGVPRLHALSLGYLEWLKGRGQSPATLRLAAMALRLLPARELRALGARDLALLARKILKAYAPESARVLIWRLKDFFAFLARRGRILTNPAETLAVPRRRRRLLGAVLSGDEISRLLSCLDVTKPADLRDRAIYEVLYGSGLRVGELRRLDESDVDMGRGEIRVRSGKGSKDRIVPLTGRAAGWIRRWLEVRPAGAERLFVSTQGGGELSEVHLQQRLRALARRAGIAGRVTPHALRRSCASHLLSAGASPMIVKELLGHAEVRTIGRYVAVAPQELKRTHERTHPRP
jgi:site-specific recombinase XerD